MSESGRAPIYFQIAGEGGMGKTHTSLTAFPRPFLLDCTPHGDGKFTAKKLFCDEFDTKYCHATSLIGAINAVRVAVDSGEFATIVVDEYSGLRKLGQAWYLNEFTKRSVFPISEWGIINRKIDTDIIWKPLENDMNMVVTSGFSDVYKDGERTGNKTANSPPNANLDIDFRMILAENEDKTDVGVRIMKNKFMSIKDRHKTMDYPLTWESIKQEAVLVGFDYCE